MRRIAIAVSACFLGNLAGCTADEQGDGPVTPASGHANEESTLHPDVVAAEATRDADGTWRFDVTLSSPYDSPERYADAWRIRSPEGEDLGVRVLTHDHASEQPFTRSLSGVAIPEGTKIVIVQGRDQVSGWGGATVAVDLED